MFEWYSVIISLNSYCSLYCILISGLDTADETETSTAPSTPSHASSTPSHAPGTPSYAPSYLRASTPVSGASTPIRRSSSVRDGPQPPKKKYQKAGLYSNTYKEEEPVWVIDTRNSTYTSVKLLRVLEMCEFAFHYFARVASLLLRMEKSHLACKVSHTRMGVLTSWRSLKSSSSLQGRF